jgi:hypothetical protein
MAATSRKITLCELKQMAQLHRVSVPLHDHRDGVRMNNKHVKRVGIAFIIFYLLTPPRDAANVVNNAFDQLGNAGNQLASFVNALGT